MSNSNPIILEFMYKKFHTPLIIFKSEFEIFYHELNLIIPTFPQVGLFNRLLSCGEKRRLYPFVRVIKKILCFVLFSLTWTMIS